MRKFGLLAALARSRGERGGPLIDLLRERIAERRGGVGDAHDDDSAGAPESEAQAFTPPPGIAVERDLAYGGDPAQRLDVYRPAGMAAGAPVIVLVHGGGWRRGDKAGSRLVQNKLLHWAARGCVVVSLNYRLVPDADPLAQAGDVGLALAFVQGQAAQWGGDPARCVLLGHSSGAHLVALFSADPGLAMQQGVAPWLATVAIDTAAFDIEAIMGQRHFGLYDLAFGDDPALWRAASPLHRLQGEPAVPLLLVCSAGRDDACAAAQAFADRATDFGGRVEVLQVALRHLQINEQLGTPGAYTEAVDAFLRSVGVH